MKIRVTRCHLVTRFPRSRSCRIERHPETMKINHEETDSHRSSLFFLRFLRFFVVDFRRSRSCRERRPEKMKIGGERSATCLGCVAFSARLIPKPRNLGRLRYFSRGARLCYV